jgi:molecular chaperone GrpE
MNERNEPSPADESEVQQSGAEKTVIPESEQPELSAEPADEKEQRVSQLEEQLSVLNDKYLRLFSDFDNYRKRSVREALELRKTAAEEIIKKLLPVIDDFERAERNNINSIDIAAVNEGVKLILGKFRGILTQQGLEAMDANGKPFNSDMHEAITEIPSPTPELKGKIVDEVEKGYLLNGKVIRYAKVVVGS